MSVTEIRIASLDEGGNLPADQLGNADDRYVPLGIYVPAAFGQFWLPKLAAAKAGTGKATWAIAGDSVSAGLYASDRDHGWAQQVHNSLRGVIGSVGDGGSGFRGSWLSPQGFTGRSVNAAFNTAWAASLDAHTGTWAEQLVTGTQVAGAGYYALATTTVGATYTAVRRGTTITIYTVSDAAASGGTPSPGFQYTVDGGSVQTVNGVTTPNTITKTVISGLSAGNHTIVITYRTGQTAKLYLSGVSGENAAGVVLNNFSVPGMNAGAPRNAETSQTNGGSGTWSGGSNYPADLVVYAMNLNDVSAGTSADQWVQFLRRYLNDVRDGGAQQGATDIVILMNHVGKFEGANLLWQDYCARIRGIGESYGAAIVNLWTIGRSSWNYWNGLGYIGSSSVPGAAGADNAHPSDLGHAFVSSVLQPLIATGRP